MKNIVTRSLSGIVYIALIVGSILGGGNYFNALCVAFALLAVWEFQGIVLPDGRRPWLVAGRVADICAAGVITALPAIFEASLAAFEASLCVLLLYPIARFVIALYDRGTDAYACALRSVASLMYVALPLAALNLAYVAFSEGKWLVLLMFAMIWLNDTGAYCVGSLIGRRRLFERLSPKKSWEGFFGGLAFCLAAGALAALFLLPDSLGLMSGLGLGAIVCVFSTWGDLFESLLKRSHGIKDSGKLIPGHGGILDRIDSLLLVAPVTLVYLFITVVI